MIRKILPLIVFGLLLTACASTRNTGGDNPSATNESAAGQSIFKDIAEGDSLFTSIKKGYCYGTCPVYEIHIYNSGHTVLTGTRNIDLLGEHTTQLSEDQMLAFIEKANAISYFDMDDEYDNKNVTDLPSTTTSIVIDGKRKQVRRRYKYPKEILAFEELFSALLESQKWDPGHAER